MAPAGVSWTCDRFVPDAQPPADGEPAYCRTCGSNLPHPIKVCSGCGHLVVFHGQDTEGCGRIFAAGWCACTGPFGRPAADYVRYA